MLSEEDYEDEDYNYVTVLIYADNTEEEYAICVDGDQVFRATTILNGFFNHLIDTYEIDCLLQEINFEEELSRWIYNWKKEK